MDPQSHRPVPPIRMIAQRGRKKQQNVRAQGKSCRRVTTISAVPDDVLLEIFDFCEMHHVYSVRPVWRWHLLVHVCQRWRQIIFASPRGLNIQILCTYGTPVRKNLGIWPTFPIIIDYHFSFPKSGIPPDDEDNVVAALDSEHLGRVCFVGLCVTGSQLGKIATVIQGPFPALKCLRISSEDGIAPVLPSQFLGGSAPCLQKLSLSGISYPTLPMLLLSTSDLVELELCNIPPTGYISPEAMVVGLAALPRLNSFTIEFPSVTPRPDRIHPPLITRTVLPALTSFQFRGASEYLENLVARIDGPQLNQITIDYVNQLFDIPAAQHIKFIERSLGPELALFKHAQVVFFSDWVAFTMSPHVDNLPWYRRPATTIISCEGIDLQVSQMAHVLSQFSATLSNLVSLKPKDRHHLEDTDNVQWLHLLRQFSTVQSLHVSHELAGRVALALEVNTGETVAEVLPSLGLISLAGQPASSIEKFIAVRRLSGRPAVTVIPHTVDHSEYEFEKRVRGDEFYVSE